ncbi:hypothetical protein R5R35_009580 [Gryllus longicercus]|uniref:Enoyl reductase (ER) domain-containing protein n=1 Tax=Gryllus longicercus TaxID=2509291 RepID=A0AAN9Z5J2_9ORTH
MNMAALVTKVLGRCSLPRLNNFEPTNISRQLTRFASVKAAVLHELCGQLKVENVERKKKLEKNEVRVKVHTCGLNVSDYLVTRGEYDVKPKLPFIPGHEVAGKIIEVGSGVSKEFGVGSRVLALSKKEFGGLSEEVVVAQSDLWTIPTTISYQTAAALADNYSTVLIGLGRRAKIKENDVLLIGAGSGGLGLAALDFAANVYKAKAIVICSSEERAAALREKGAWSALTYNDKGIINKVKEVTDGKGVQVVFDALGGPVFETAVKCVAHEGKVVVAGHAIRQAPPIKVAEVLPQSFSIMGVSLRNYLVADYETYRQAVQDALDMCEQELINPYVSQVLKLSEVNKGFKKLEDTNCPGKVLIEMDD